MKLLPFHNQQQAEARIAAHLKDKAARVLMHDSHMISRCREADDVFLLIESTGYVEIKARYSINDEPQVVDLRDLLVTDEGGQA